MKHRGPASPLPSRWVRAWWYVGRWGRVLFFVVSGGLIVAGVLLGVAGILDSREPAYWGTFTEESCVDAGRRGCRSLGTWVSDDRSIRLEEVYLDGSPNSDGSVEAQYRPTGIINGADNNIVHTETGVALAPILPWVIVAMGVGYSIRQWFKWRGTWR